MTKLCIGYIATYIVVAGMYVAILACIWGVLIAATAFIFWSMPDMVGLIIAFRVSVAFGMIGALMYVFSKDGRESATLFVQEFLE